MALPRMKPPDGVAWVTGASSGIGAAVALELARRGWTVAITARRIEALEAVARQAEGLSGRIVAHAGDVTDAQAMEGVVDAIESIHGPVALAFLNAGIASGGQGRSTPDVESVEAIIGVNLLGVVKSLLAVQRRMVARSRGQIAVNASLVGYRGLPGAAAYGAAKAGAIHFCESLRFDCEAAGIRLQIVNPGFVDTPMTQGRSFPMPFLLTVDEGARRIADGFESGGFEIAFPRRLAWLLKAARLLPYPAYFALMSRFAKHRA